MRQKNYFIKFHQNSYKNIFACTEIQYLLLNYQFKRNCSNLYTFDLISSEMSKVKFSNLKLKSNDKNHNVKGILYFICILYMEKDVKMVFTLQPMVSFCSAFKLNSCLVRAKLLRGNWQAYVSVRVNDTKFTITSQKLIHLLL